MIVHKNTLKRKNLKKMKSSRSMKRNTKGGKKQNETSDVEQETIPTEITKTVADVDFKTEIVVKFLSMLNTVKLFHWNTKSFSQHKATDELYSELNGHIDKFVEVLLGKKENRINLLEQKITLFDKYTTEDFKQKLYEYRDYLTVMETVLDPKKNTDLLNIRDEILATINQTIYLFTLS